MTRHDLDQQFAGAAVLAFFATQQFGWREVISSIRQKREDNFVIGVATAIFNDRHQVGDLHYSPLSEFSSNVRALGGECKEFRPPDPAPGDGVSRG